MKMKLKSKLKESERPPTRPLFLYKQHIENGSMERYNTIPKNRKIKNDKEKNYDSL